MFFFLSLDFSGGICSELISLPFYAKKTVKKFEIPKIQGVSVANGTDIVFLEVKMSVLYSKVPHLCDNFFAFFPAKSAIPHKCYFFSR